MYRDVLGFSITPFMQRVMNINGFFASIMRTGKKSEDSKDSLPPGVPIPILPVDYLKVKPDNWVGGEGSYCVPVDSDWGLWFNFTMNNPANTAVLSSVKGMNPITGQRIGGYDLEGYQEDCPIHNKPFSKGRLCTECGFKWPAQNYISLPNKYYLDGFRTPDGNVRQFYFTEDMAKSIPEKVIGKEDCVPAFGFCFYKLKNFKGNYEEGKHIKNEFPANCYSNHGAFLYSTGFACASAAPERLYSSGLVPDGSMEFGLGTDILCEGSRSKGTTLGGSVRGMSAGSSTSAYYSNASLDGVAQASASSEVSYTKGFVNTSDIKSKSTKSAESVMYHSFSSPIRAEVGIGAGAKIKQAFEKSHTPIEDWEKKPAGVIRLYFVFQEEFEKYASLGFNDLKGNESGYLEGLPVGGSHE